MHVQIVHFPKCDHFHQLTVRGEGGHRNNISRGGAGLKLQPKQRSRLLLSSSTTRDFGGARKMRGFRTKKLWHRFLKKKASSCKLFQQCIMGWSHAMSKNIFCTYLFEIEVEVIDSVR